MGSETMKGFLLKKSDGSWLINSGGHTHGVSAIDASHCLDSDDGNFVEFTLETDVSGYETARLGENITGRMSWNEIEEWYGSDNYPPFGGPFTDALTTFEWLKMNFEPPRIKKQKTNNIGGNNE